MSRHPKTLAAAVGLVLGVGIAVLVLLVIAIVRGGEDREHIEGLLHTTHSLAEANATRLEQQAQGTHAALDILCRLKVYDLVTGSQAEHLRLAPGSPLASRHEAQVIERALRLVQAIPSAASCDKTPHYPGVKATVPSKKPLTERQIEQLVGAASRPPATVPPAASSPPATARRAPTPRRRPPPPAPRARRGPARRRPATRRPSTSSPTATPAPVFTSPPAATTIAPVAPAPPASTTPAPPAPPGHGGEPPPGHGGEPPGQQKKHGPLGICVEALGIEVLC